MQHSHQSYSRLFVEQWLDTLETGVDDHPIEASLSASKRKRDNTPEPALFMSTPPPSNGARDRSPAKRRRVIPDRTMSTTSAILGANKPDMGPEAVSAAASDTWTASTPTRSRATASVRSTSPSKKTQSLLALEKPVCFANLSVGEGLLPDDVRDLYRRLSNIAVDHEGILPSVVKEEITRAAGRQCKPWYFRDAAEQVEGQQQQRKISALAELDLLQELCEAAVLCADLDSSEAEWNVDVHGPLLNHALKGACPHVRKAVVTRAEIARPFVPKMMEHTVADYVEKKMVDFALVLDLAVHEAPSLGRKGRGAGPAGDAAWYRDLADKLMRVVQSQADCTTINQSMYGPLWFRPVGVSIETKVGGSAGEGRSQLAVWTAAWHQRMSKFVRLGEKIVTLPLVLVTGHLWQLSFACDRGDRLEIVGEIELGQTNSLLGMYQLIAAIRELGSWVEGPFATWMTRTLDAGGGRLAGGAPLDASFFLRVGYTVVR